MSIPAVSSYSNNAIAFKGRKAPVLKDVRRNGDVEERRYETEATTGKKWGVGIASSFIPGLGQAINGDWGKATLYFVGSLATGIGTQILAAQGKFKSGILGGLATLGIGIASIVDAVKSAKSEEVQIVKVQDAE